MKKIISVTAAFLIAASSAFADRYVEFGTTTSIQFDENLMTVGDVYGQGELVIDFPAIADSMDDAGFVLDAIFDEKFYANFNTKKFGIGAFASLNGYNKIGIGKEFWELLAYGNKLDETQELVNVYAGMEYYAEIGAPVRFKVSRLNFRVTPSIFAPLIYIPTPNAKLVVNTQSDGTLEFEANAQFEAYTLVDFSKIVQFDEEGKPVVQEITIDSLTDGVGLGSDIFKSVGFDVDAEVTFDLFGFLSVGGYAHVPVVPGRLDSSISGSVTTGGKLNPVLDSLTRKEEIKFEMEEPTFSGIIYGNDEYSINRPFRFGLVGDIHFNVAGDLHIIPRIGYSTRNPFGADYDFKTNSTLEYSLGIDWRFLKVFDLALSTEYANSIFSNSLGFAVDLRVARLGISLGTSAASFLDAFSIYGVNGKVDLCFGF